MKKMKKLISVITAMLILTMCIAPVISASEVTAIVEISDSKLGVVSISDTFAETNAGKKINILVLNPGYTAKDAETNSQAVQYQDVAVVNKEGKTSCMFKLNLPDNFTDGTFTVRLGGNAYEGATKDYSVYYLPFAAQLNLVQDLYDKVMAFDMANEYAKNVAVTALKDSKNALAYGTNAFNTVDAVVLAQSLKSYWTEYPVSFGSTDSEKELALKAIQEKIKVSAVVQAFNEGKSEVLFSAKNDILDGELLKLSESLAETTIESLFGALNSDGKINVNNGLLNKNLADEKELAKLYAKLVITNAITNNKTLGSEVVSDAVTSANASYAGYSVPTYFALTGKTSANTLIVQHKGEITVDNLAEVIEKYAKQSITPTDNNLPVISGESSMSHASSSTGSITQGTVNVPKEQNRFTDILGHKWAENAINNLAEKGVINGTGNNCFEPDKNLTREQAVKIICLALDMNIVSSSKLFDDETENSWYNNFIATARNAGFVKGKTENLFGIGESITRQDFAVMVYRALKSPELSGAAAEFSDSAYIADYADDAIKYFKANGIINGYEDGSFKPLNTITRAEAAQLIYSIISK